MSAHQPENPSNQPLPRDNKPWNNSALEIPALGISLSAGKTAAAADQHTPGSTVGKNMFGNLPEGKREAAIEAQQAGFNLIDETIAFRTAAHSEVRSPSVAAEDTLVLSRIGLDDNIHALNELHTSEIDYWGVLQAYEELDRNHDPSRVDVLLLDGCASMQRPELNNEMHFTIAMDGAFKALEELKSNGNIKAFGLVSDSAEFCQRALREGDWDLFLLNHRYTLLEQWPLFNLLPECEEHATGILVGHAFNTGALHDKARWNFTDAPPHIQARVENILHICRLHDVPIEAVALQFPLAHPAVLAVVINEHDQLDPRKTGQWLNQPLPASLWDDLKLGGVMHEEAPVPVSTRH